MHPENPTNAVPGSTPKTEHHGPLHLVLCADGTGNKGGSTPDTNVFKIFKAVNIHDPKVRVKAEDGQEFEQTIEQRTFYDAGVGTSDFAPWRAITGAAGIGFRENVLDLYRFLARNYDPDRETKIFLFGFSRGAATVRALTGFMHERGLIDGRKLAKDDLQSKALHEFNRYMNRKQEPCEGAPHQQVDIHFIGVWDTVSALGAPKYGKAAGGRAAPLTSMVVKVVFDTLDAIADWFFNHKSYEYGLNERIKSAYQALAIDDERTSFRPKVWREAKRGDKSNIVEQVWFAGMHSNVGGGYEREGLADVALQWMVERARHRDLIFIEGSITEIHERSNARGLMHDSRSGLGLLFRYHPRHIEKLTKGRAEGLPRIHRSVIERMQERVDDYAPQCLPREFDLVDTAIDPTTGTCKSENWRVEPIADNEAKWKALTARLGARVEHRKGIYSLMMTALAFLLAIGFYYWISPMPKWGRSGIFGLLADGVEYLVPSFLGGLVEVTVVAHPYVLVICLFLVVCTVIWRTGIVGVMQIERAKLRELILARGKAQDAGDGESPNQHNVQGKKWLFRVCLGALALGLVYMLARPRPGLDQGEAIHGDTPLTTEDRSCRTASVDYAASCGDVANLDSLVQLEGPGDCALVRVKARSRWNASGLLLEQGVDYRFDVREEPGQEAPGWCDWWIWSGPDGWTIPANAKVSELRECTDKDTWSVSTPTIWAMRFAEWRSRADTKLLTLVGVNSGAGQHFEIGSQRARYQPKTQGEFCSYANDSTFLYSNNGGSLLVRVTRTSE